jgi:hypothetical protein
VNKAQLQSNASTGGPECFMAEYINANDSYYRFVFAPDKKWRYDAKVAKLDEHVFKVYIATDNVVTAAINSSAFEIVPVWKSEDILDKVDRVFGEANSAADAASQSEGDGPTDTDKPPSRANPSSEYGSHGSEDGAEKASAGGSSDGEDEDPRKQLPQTKHRTHGKERPKSAGSNGATHYPYKVHASGSSASAPPPAMQMHAVHGGLPSLGGGLAVNPRQMFSPRVGNIPTLPPPQVGQNMAMSGTQPFAPSYGMF